MIDLTDVLLNEGRVISCRAALEAEEFRYRFGRFRIAEKFPVFLTAEHAEGRKLILDGDTKVRVVIPCARCLEPVGVGLTIQFHLEMDIEKNDYIDGYNLDVDQLVHDEALLVWPEKVLCREDCKGLCSICGQNLNDGSCGCENADLDPRMAKVLDIFSNFKEV